MNICYILANTFYYFYKDYIKVNPRKIKWAPESGSFLGQRKYICGLDDYTDRSERTRY